jgi:hypothetical protein
MYFIRPKMWTCTLLGACMQRTATASLQSRLIGGLQLQARSWCLLDVLLHVFTTVHPGEVQNLQLATHTHLTCRDGAMQTMTVSRNALKVCKELRLKPR